MSPPPSAGRQLRDGAPLRTLPCVDLERIRRLVEAEVDRALAGARARRPLVTEEMVEAARRRGAGLVEHPPGAIVTPAARGRARDLGVEVREVPGDSGLSPEERRAAVEAVLEAVLARLRRRPAVARARAAPSAPGRAGGRRPLVTVEGIRAAAGRGESIRLPPGAIVTPAARDEARARGVRIETA